MDKARKFSNQKASTNCLSGNVPPWYVFDPMWDTSRPKTKVCPGHEGYAPAYLLSLRSFPVEKQQNIIRWKTLIYSMGNENDTHFWDKFLKNDDVKNTVVEYNKYKTWWKYAIDTVPSGSVYGNTNKNPLFPWGYMNNLFVIKLKEK